MNIQNIETNAQELSSILQKLNINDQKINSVLDQLNSKNTNTEYNEEVLNPIERRFTVLPIKKKDIWAMYKKQQASFWTAEEIDFSQDYDDFQTLNQEEQLFLKRILAFFAASDGIVNFNLEERFTKEIQLMEAKITYDFQKMMENIHGEVYSNMLENLIKDKDEKEKLFNAIKNIPTVKKMADWAFKWIDSSERFAFRIIAFAIVEGVFFSGAFAAIFWFKKYRNKGKNFLPGLIKSNEFIARDEGMHTQFACILYSHIKNKLTQDEINNIFMDGVKVSKSFINDALPKRLIGMNKEMMNDYIEYVADRLIVELGYKKIYNKKNPFKFMETIGLQAKTNFFEMRETSYQNAHVNNKSKDPTNFVISDSF